MWTVCIFFNLLGTLVPISDAISAVISPVDMVFVEKGDDVILHCTLLDLNSSIHTAEDILWYKDNELLPSKLSHAIILNSSQLTVINSTFDDSGNYGCGFPEDTYNDRELILVTVASPPAPVQNLTCMSPNVLHVYCTWEEGAVETNTRNFHKAHFKFYGKETLEEVNQDSGDNSCDFELVNGTKVIVRVTSTNNFGTTKKEIIFDSQTQVTPNPPENVRAAPHSENGNSTLNVTWNLPSEWRTDSFFSLDYRVRYRSESSSEMKEKTIVGAFMWTFLENLDAFTTYNIEVAAKSPVTTDEYWGEPGMTSATTLEGSPFGSVSDLSILSDTDSEQAGLRHVQLKWEGPPEHQWRSRSISYVVHLIPQDTSSGHSLKEYIKKVNIPSILINNLSKYQTYYVTIKPFNNYGDGPETTFQNAVPDRTSAPGKPTDLNVALMKGNTRKITWQPPQNPNGLIYEYEVVVTANALLSSNETNDSEKGALKVRTESQVLYVTVHCSELTENGHSMEVHVAATTKNYTNHILKGDYAEFVQDGVCKEENGANWIFIGIFIPCIIIVSSIIALLLWNFFKDTCVETPEPYIPNSIKKGGHIGIGNIPSSIIILEKERFDDLKPRRETIDISGGQQTLSNLYQNPRSEPKNALERINSHDSGTPESPGSHCEDCMVCYNQGFVEDSMDRHRGPIQSISRNVSVGESDGVSISCRQSGISNGSKDSGTEVVVNEDGIIMSPRPTSSSTDELSSQDPYYELSALPLSSQSSDLSSTYIKTPVGHDEKTRKDEENADLDEFENDCPFDDGDSTSGYLQQYQLGSPTSLTAEVPPYMKMTPTSPLSVGSSFTNGYVSPESLPCTRKGITRGLHDPTGSVPEEYSTMVDFQGCSEGYIKHNAIPTSKQISEIPEIYIKHTSLPSTDVNYQDDYPDFNRIVPAGHTLEPKQESAGYVQHKDISVSSLSQEPPYIP